MSYAVLKLLCVLVAIGGVPASAPPGHALPPHLPIIAENSDQLQEIGVIGRGAATSLDWHPNGTMLAVGSPTGVWLLDETLQDLIRTAITLPITDLAWSPDGSRLAFSSNLHGTCTVQIWDAALSAPLHTFDMCGERVQWNADGTFLAASNPSSSANEVYVIIADSGSIQVYPGHGAVWSPAGAALFTQTPGSGQFGAPGPTLNSWDAVTGANVHTYTAAPGPPLEPLWAMDDSTIAVMCIDLDDEADIITSGLCAVDIANTGEVIKLRDVVSYEIGRPFSLFRSVAWNADRTQLAFVNESFHPAFLSDVRILDTDTNDTTNVGSGMRFDWKPGTNQVTVIVGNGEIRTVDPDRPADAVAHSRWFTGPVHQIAIRPNSDQIASTGYGYEQGAHIWDIERSHLEPIFSVRAEPAEIVDFTSDGRELIAGGTVETDIVGNQQIRAYDANTGERLRVVSSYYDQGSSPPHDAWNAEYTKALVLPESIRTELGIDSPRAWWSPDSATVAVFEPIGLGGPFDISTRHAATGDVINRFSSATCCLQSIEWSPDNARIAVLVRRSWDGVDDDLGVVVFSVTPGQDYDVARSDYALFRSIPAGVRTPEIVAVAWNRDSNLLAVALANTLEIHTLDGGGEPLVALPAYGIVDLEWASDDRFIAGGSADGTIRLWSIPSED
ncbi:MAG: WD40 repeat domain-containing protein [Chloroflexi bacterium]|nr:WD40 repeat domain-containing protein [Chloroflexota bacterium]